MVETPSLLLAFAAGFVSFLSRLVASVFAPRLGRDVRPTALVRRAGPGGPVVAGAASAIAWTPCVGLTLGAILGLAATSAGTAQGGLLLAVHSVGLAIAFEARRLLDGLGLNFFSSIRRSLHSFIPHPRWGWDHTDRSTACRSTTPGTRRTA